ncbi:MAG: hypothetical protein ABW203_00130 [Novosphingobium sp.]
MDDAYVTEPAGGAPPRRSRRLGLVALALLVTLLLGGAAALWGAAEAGWIAWRGFDPRPDTVPAATVSAPPQLIVAPPPAEQAQAALGVRVATLEQQIGQIAQQTAAAADNMTRAEALMIAFAVRRAIERGLPLGFLENQLKLRFGDAQPNAVATLVAAGTRPVTLDRLTQNLDALGPQLAEAPPEESTWARVQREFAGLFVLRRADAPSPLPQRRLERAMSDIEIGRVDAAIAEVERLPGRAAASNWLDSARAYVVTQRALDLIETAALLEPHQAGADPAAARGEAAPATPDETVAEPAT